jgi:hypothetical protein
MKAALRALMDEGDILPGLRQGESAPEAEEQCIVE